MHSSPNEIHLVDQRRLAVAFSVTNAGVLSCGRETWADWESLMILRLPTADLPKDILDAIGQMGKRVIDATPTEAHGEQDDDKLDLGTVDQISADSAATVGREQLQLKGTSFGDRCQGDSGAIGSLLVFAAAGGKNERL